jgi:hypothetical protein
MAATIAAGAPLPETSATTAQSESVNAMASKKSPPIPRQGIVFPFRQAYETLGSLIDISSE